MWFTSCWGGNSGKSGEPSMDANAPEVVIAVMGATGTGKSTFINHVSGANFGVGKGLQSFTNTVQAADAFNLDGHRVVLIDTPGFDNTRSDTDVLKMIATFLESSYKQGTTLAGILYFHRISDFRMGGISMKNWEMFRKLCGDNTLRNAVIVTNMWGEVNSKVGNAREAELMKEDIFFKPALDRGAQIARHKNTVTSARKIIRLVFDNQSLPLRIQEELVNEHKDIFETGAGEELNRENNTQIKKHQEEMRALKAEMQQAIKEKDEETRRELEIEAQKMQNEVAKLKSDAERLASNHKEEMQRTIKEKDEEARRELETKTQKMRSEMAKLKSDAERSASNYKKEKASLEARLTEVEARDKGAGFFTKIGAALDGAVEEEES